MKIFINVKSSYGQCRFYPGCEKSWALADIAGTKTLTENTLKQAKRLGFEIVYKQDPLEKILDKLDMGALA
jgi:hypothetical protein